MYYTGELIQPECVLESWLLNQKIYFEALGKFHLKIIPGLWSLDGSPVGAITVIVLNFLYILG